MEQCSCFPFSFAATRDLKTQHLNTYLTFPNALSIVCISLCFCFCFCSYTTSYFVGPLKSYLICSIHQAGGIIFLWVCRSKTVCLQKSRRKIDIWLLFNKMGYQFVLGEWFYLTRIEMEAMKWMCLYGIRGSTCCVGRYQNNNIVTRMIITNLLNSFNGILNPLRVWSMMECSSIYINPSIEAMEGSWNKTDSPSVRPLIMNYSIGKCVYSNVEMPTSSMTCHILCQGNRLNISESHMRSRDQRYETKLLPCLTLPVGCV